MPQITIHAYGRNLNLDAAEAEAPMNADGGAAAAEDSDFDDLWLGGDVVEKPPPIAVAVSDGDGEASSCRSRARLLLRSVMAALSPTHYWEPAPLRISMGLLFTRQRSRGFVRVSGLELWMALMTSVFVVVASAFDDVVCTAVTGVLGVLYAAAGVFLVATRLYRLPLDNIVVPVNYFSFAAVCLLKAVSQAGYSPDSFKAAAEALQMIQSICLVLKMMGGAYTLWRERILYEVEMTASSQELAGILGFDSDSSSCSSRSDSVEGQCGRPLMLEEYTEGFESFFFDHTSSHRSAHGSLSKDIFAVDVCEAPVRECFVTPTNRPTTAQSALNELRPVDPYGYLTKGDDGGNAFEDYQAAKDACSALERAFMIAAEGEKNRPSPSSIPPAALRSPQYDRRPVSATRQTNPKRSPSTSSSNDNRVVDEVAASKAYKRSSETKRNKTTKKVNQANTSKSKPSLGDWGDLF